LAAFEEISANGDSESESFADQSDELDKFFVQHQVHDIDIEESARII